MPRANCAQRSEPETQAKPPDSRNYFQSERPCESIRFGHQLRINSPTSHPQTVLYQLWKLARRLTRPGATGNGMHASWKRVPVIQKLLCVACGTCEAACPYGCLGEVDGVGALVQPDRCIGDGACMAACSHGAIRMEWRRVRQPEEIPDLRSLPAPRCPPSSSTVSPRSSRRSAKREGRGQPIARRC